MKSKLRTSAAASGVRRVMKEKSYDEWSFEGPAGRDRGGWLPEP